MVEQERERDKEKGRGKGKGKGSDVGRAQCSARQFKSFRRQCRNYF